MNDEIEAALKEALYLACATVAFHGRDIGTDRQQRMLEGLEVVALRTEKLIRKAMGSRP